MEGGSNVDGDESGGTSPSRKGAGTGTFGPPKLVGDGSADHNCFWRKGLDFQGFSVGGKNRSQRGASGEVPMVQAPVGRGQGGGRAL